MFYYGIIYREDEYEAQQWLSRSVGNGNKYADALLGKLYVESDLFGEFRNEGFSHLFKASVTVASLLPICSANILWRARS